MRFASTHRPLLLAITLSLLAACGGRTLGGPSNSDAAVHPPDAAVHRDATIRPDAAPRPDGGTSCQPDEWWELMPTALQSVTVLTRLSPQGNISQGVSVRLKAMVPVGGCDQMAGVSPIAYDDAHEAHLQGYVWRYHGPAICPAMETLAPELIVLKDLAPGVWTVWDDFSMDGPGPNPMASIEIRDCLLGEDCGCALWDGIPGRPGSSCQYDCMCEWPLSCLYEGLLGHNGSGICERTCSTDSDCPAPEACVMGVLDMPEGICQGYRGDECGDDPLVCPAGSSCQWRGASEAGVFLCVPDPISVFPGEVCTEDCDCPAGFSCDQMDATLGRTCQIKCRGNGDCPEALSCEDPGGWWVNNRVCVAFNEL